MNRYNIGKTDDSEQRKVSSAMILFTNCCAHAVHSMSYSFELQFYVHPEAMAS